MSSETDAHAGAREPANDPAEGHSPALVETSPQALEAVAPDAGHVAHDVVEHAASEAVSGTPHETAPEAAAEPVVEHMPAPDPEPDHEAAALGHPLETDAPVEAAAEPAPHVEEPAPVEIAAAAPEIAPEIAPEAPHEPHAFADEAAEPDHSALEHEEEKGAKDEFFEIAKTIFYALLIALVLRVLFFQPFTIPSASMEPNLYEGDYIIVSKWDYGYSKHSIPFSPSLFTGRLFNTTPKRGDIVVFKLPRDNKTDFIKRVIGLPGDTIQVINDQLMINGKAVPNQMVGKLKVALGPDNTVEAADQIETLPNGVQHRMQDISPYSTYDNTAVYTVPAGYYFMMGDNRDNSLDSRVAPEDGGVGFVPAENLVGKAEIVLFSWHPGASLWKPWTWFTKVRPSRFFHSLK